jgi:putative transposase
VAKSGEAENLQGQGATIRPGARSSRASEQTFYRSRTNYGALKEDEVHRLKALETEIARLRRIVAEDTLDVSIPRGLGRGNA